jgi:hypothetical protein
MMLASRLVSFGPQGFPVRVEGRYALGAFADTETRLGRNLATRIRAYDMLTR